MTGILAQEGLNDVGPIRRRRSGLFAAIALIAVKAAAAPYRYACAHE
jgi:hypothetical protein